MIYAGIDVNIITHAKLVEACAGGDLSPFGLWTFGMCYAQLHETNGKLARAVVLTALGGRRNVMLAAKLVAAGLWLLNDDGSWSIFNYGKKNQSAEEIRAKKEASAIRVQRWRERRNAVGNADVTPDVTQVKRVRTQPEPEPEPDNTTRKQDLGEGASPAPATVTRIGRRKPETSCPDSEASAGELRDWTERWQIPVGHGELQHFLDHHRKTEARFRDWAAAWRTWLRNAPKFAGRSAAAPRQAIGAAAAAPWMNPTASFDFQEPK